MYLAYPTIKALACPTTKDKQQKLTLVRYKPKMIIIHSVSIVATHPSAVVKVCEKLIAKVSFNNALVLMFDNPFGSQVQK